MNETTNISGMEMEVETGKLYWADLPFYKFGYQFHPFMLLEDGHIIPIQIKYGKSLEKVWRDVAFDRDYIKAKLSYVLKPLQLSNAKLKAIIDLALGEG